MLEHCHVKTAVRVFSSSQKQTSGGPARRELRAPPPKAFDTPKEKTTAAPKEAAAKLLYIGKETHYSIEACCDESQPEQCCVLW